MKGCTKVPIRVEEPLGADVRAKASIRTQSKPQAVSIEFRAVCDEKALYQSAGVDAYSAPTIHWHLKATENAVLVLPLVGAILLLPVVVPADECTYACERESGDSSDAALLQRAKAVAGA